MTQNNLIIPRTATNAGKLPQSGDLLEGEFATDPFLGLLYAGGQGGTSITNLNKAGSPGTSLPGPVGPQGIQGPIGQTGDQGPIGNFELRYTSNTSNRNIATDLSNVGWGGVSAVIVHIMPGVTISSNNTGSFALDTSGMSAAFALVNEGAIVGCGGNGGQGGAGNGNAGVANGSSGGPALRLTINCVITNTGTIGGGGGGGGGGQGAGNPASNASGGGGGGGSGAGGPGTPGVGGSGAGGAGASGSGNSTTTGGPGGSGTAGTGGGGGGSQGVAGGVGGPGTNNGATGQGAGGGGGGGLGASGGQGGNSNWGFIAIGGGGAPGAAVVGNSFASYARQGNIFGALT